MKTVTVCLLILLLVGSASGQIPLLEENFLYAPGRLVNTLPYNVRASSGTYKQTISWTKLTYPGYAGSGIGWSDSLTADGDDYSIDWANYASPGISLPATYVNSGSVYLAALVNVQSITSTAEYFLSMHYNNTFSGRVYVRQAGSDFNFGVSKGGTPISYETNARTLGQTYLIVMKYTFVAGTFNDQIDFWVNPAIGGSEPSATIAGFLDGARNDIAAWVGVAIRQGAATAPRVLVGGIRMATDWPTAVAPQFVWTGAMAGDFQEATNWSPARTSPSVNDVVVFNSGGSISPTNLPTQSISGLVIDNGTSLTLPGTGLTVSGSLTLASGSLDNTNYLTLGSGATIIRASGWVDVAPSFGSSTNLVYCGSTGQSTGGECPSTVTSLTIANPAGTTLNSNLQIDSLLKVGGKMWLNGNTVTLGTSAPTTGSLTFTGNYGGFTGGGTFKRWFKAATIEVSTGRGNNGYFPFTTSDLNNRALSISGTASSGGSVSVAYNDVSSVSSISFVENALTFVNRTDACWTVGVGDGLTSAAIALAINGAGIPNINAIGDLNVSEATVAAPGTFSATTGTTTAVVVNRTGLTQATLPTTYYIAATSSSALPVQLTAMTATAIRSGAMLRWTTASEVDNAGFEIERREIGDLRPSTSLGAGLSSAEYQKVGFVAGAGTSTSPREYTFTDAPAPGRYAYRLKQIDRNGGSTYFSEVEVEIGLAPKELSLGNYPNPFNPTTSVEFTLATDERAMLKVFNVLGQEVATLFDGMAKAGQFYRQSFDASSMPSGVYYYTLETGSSRLVRRMLLMK